jgi:arginine/serine-rich splicing factor 7
MSRIYVGHLASRTRERDLDEVFDKYGRIRRIEMKNGYAFIEYDDYRDADDAVYDMHGRTLDGARLRVEHARGSGGSRRDERRGDGRCYNCGKEGHWARDCPDESARDKCFNCGRSGHLARECRERRGTNPSRHVRPGSASPRRSRSPRMRTTRRSPRRESRSPRRKESRSPRRSPGKERHSASPRRSPSPRGRSPPPSNSAPSNGNQGAERSPRARSHSR